MGDDRFVRHPKLPFAECRCSRNSVQHYKEHIHKRFSIGAIDRGEVIYQVEGKQVPLHPGSLALINPDTLHSCNPPGKSERSYYILFLDVNWCLDVQQSLWECYAFVPLKSAVLRDAAIYDSAIDAMETLLGDSDVFEKEQKLVALVGQIFQEACEPGGARKDPPLRVERLKRRLGADLDQDLSLRDFASELQINPYTLLRQFKAAAGITPHAYRLNCRIEYAKQLLQQGVEICQVAVSCGFFDQSHFHRHFKEITTVTPRQYQINFVQ